MASADTREKEIFRDHYSKLCNSMVDIDNLLPHFVQVNIIQVVDLEEIKTKPRTTNKVEMLLQYISGPLQAGNVKSFHTLLSIMEEHGAQATRELASTMRNLITTDTTAHSNLKKEKQLQQTEQQRSPVDASSTFSQLTISSENQHQSTIEETFQEQSTKLQLDTKKQSMSDSMPLTPETVEKELSVQHAYPGPIWISSYDWACTGGHGICKICSTASIGRSPTQPETQKLQEAISSGDTITIKTMIKQDSIDVNAVLLPILPYRVPLWAWKFWGGYTPLMCAVEEGKLSSVEILVQLGADIMATATQLLTGQISPPQRAVSKGLIDIVYYFVTKCKLDISKFKHADQKTIYAMVKQYEETHTRAKVHEMSLKTRQHGLVVSHRILAKGKWGYIREATFRDQQVAAKFLGESNMDSSGDLITQENIKEEIDILAQCNHKNLIRLLGVVLNHPSIMVFELMEYSLQLALSGGQASADHAHPICLDVANGLYYLHNFQPNALMHRNIHSSNVLLKADGPNWITKLSDFSLAQFANVSSQNVKSVSHSTYTAPEISKHSSHLQTTKVDIFGYGILFIEALLQELPNYTIKDMITILGQRWPHHVAFLTLCTSDDPGTRPNINEVINTVTKLHQKSTTF